VAAAVAVVACGLLVLAVTLLIVNRLARTRLRQPRDGGRLDRAADVRSHPDRPDRKRLVLARGWLRRQPREEPDPTDHVKGTPIVQGTPGRHVIRAEREGRIRVGRWRRLFVTNNGAVNWSMAHSIGAKALLAVLILAVLFGPFAVGFDSAPGLAPTNPPTADADVQRVVHQQRLNEQAAAEALATYNLYREAEVTALTTTGAPRTDLEQYVTEPLLTSLSARIRQAHRGNTVYRGLPTWDAHVVAIDLEAKPATVIIDDCFDPTGWHPVDATSGKPISGQDPVHRQVLTATAVRVGEHEWRIAQSQPSQQNC
jgi:hypothetical protein